MKLRLDLTERSLYTLSPSTGSILDTLEEPITLRLFFSDKLTRNLSSFRVYSDRVRSLLKEYERRSNGMIRLIIVDPEPFSEAEDQAVQAGLQSIPLDSTSGQKVYFGLVVTNAVDQSDVIPFFHQSQERFLEATITKIIYTMNNPIRPTVGIIGRVSPEGVAGVSDQDPHSSYRFYSQLHELFDLRVLTEEDVKNGIDSSITLLMIVRPGQLQNHTRYAIDQFILSGGKALVFVDPWIESVRPQQEPGGLQDQKAVLPDLLEAWGIQFDSNQIVADSDLALNVGSREGNRTVPYPIWMQISEELLNPQEVVTANLQNLIVASAGSLVPDPDRDITFIPLVSSSSQAVLIAADQPNVFASPEQLLASLADQTDSDTRVIAALLTGRFSTIFPDGPPVLEETSESTTTHRTESDHPTSLIIVADTDLLEDHFWIREQNFFGQRLTIPVAGNGDFITNALDTLSGSEDLISLRSRAGSTRPFAVMETLRQQAAQQYLRREQELIKRLRETEQRIAQIQRSSDNDQGGELITTQEREAIDQFRQQVVEIRQQLRDVQYQLNKDIESLSTRLKVINIGLVPVLLSLCAIALTIRQNRRRHRKSITDRAIIY